MHLLYIDDSGGIEDTKCRFCVLAGFSVFETQTYWLEKSINELVIKWFPDFPSLELHGTYMRTGKNEWRHIPAPAREQAMKDLLTLIKIVFPK
ncbi:MAG: hypothetical protein Pg6C_01480 [Treponemataceae bacterium]|nr:MAG: hypothetical protein Pg6C_01480 [Treponemataceae bacterium]